jgi:hypothetical protein
MESLKHWALPKHVRSKINYFTSCINIPAKEEGGGIMLEYMNGIYEYSLHEGKVSKQGEPDSATLDS